MHESNKSIFLNWRYCVEYKNASTNLRKIIGSKYDQLSSSEQKCLKQAYAHIKSLGTYDRIKDRYKHGTDAELQNWSEASRIYRNYGVIGIDNKSLWNYIYDEIREPNKYHFTTIDPSPTNRENYYNYLIKNTPYTNNGALTGGAAPLFYEAEASNPIASDPLMIDLNGDGIVTTAINNGKFFDHQNDGFAERSAWVSNEDGVLFIDKNNNGIIDNGIAQPNPALVNSV
ncbi:hypothetical protein IKQ26_05810 [bacterium]|nr:hypothetical protein [bacterium]